MCGTNCRRAHVSSLWKMQTYRKKCASGVKRQKFSIIISAVVLRPFTVEDGGEFW